MKWQIPDLQTRLKLISVIILLVGLGGAAWIYQRAEKVPYGALGYENAGGTLYPVMPEDSKQYLRSMELYGGKANVLADQFRRWFVGLWQGKALAFIIACTTIITSFVFFYAANHLTPPLKSDVRSEDNRG
jgi:ABC-type phosphate/phosphonate transport system permease subunit